MNDKNKFKIWNTKDKKFEDLKRKDDFNRGYEWLENYIKSHSHHGIGDALIKQINKLRLIPTRCEYVLEQELQQKQQQLDLANEIIDTMSVQFKAISRDVNTLDEIKDYFKNLALEQVKKVG